MKKPGQIVLFRFPQTDLDSGRLRPALLLERVPGPYEDWLVCMVSAQLHRYNSGYDELVSRRDADFDASSLKAASVIRVCRLAVVDHGILLGAVEEISKERLVRIMKRLAHWLDADL